MSTLSSQEHTKRAASQTRAVRSPPEGRRQHPLILSWLELAKLTPKDAWLQPVSAVSGLTRLLYVFTAHGVSFACCTCSQLIAPAQAQRVAEADRSRSVGEALPTCPTRARRRRGCTWLALQRRYLAWHTSRASLKRSLPRSSTSPSLGYRWPAPRL